MKITKNYSPEMRNTLEVSNWQASVVCILIICSQYFIKVAPIPLITVVYIMHFLKIENVSKKFLNNYFDLSTIYVIVYFILLTNFYGYQLVSNNFTFFFLCAKWETLLGNLKYEINNNFFPIIIIISINYNAKTLEQKSKCRPLIWILYKLHIWINFIKCIKTKI